jgi:hypothetical protein
MPVTASGQKIVNVITESAKTANAQNFASAFRTGAVYVLVLLVVVCGISLTLPRKLRVSQNHA